MISLINSGCSSVIAFVQEVAKLAILTNRQSTAPHKYTSDKEPYVSEILYNEGKSIPNSSALSAV